MFLETMYNNNTYLMSNTTKIAKLKIVAFLINFNKKHKSTAWWWWCFMNINKEFSSIYERVIEDFKDRNILGNAWKKP